MTIPDSVTSIGASAFWACKGLTSVTLPRGITTIDSNTFSGCTSLAGITIPNGVTSIGNSAFWNCKSLTSVTIPTGVTLIKESAFESCDGLSSVTIPNSVTSIEIGAFAESGLISVTIPNSITSLERGVFANCAKLTAVNIPDSVTSIGASAFYNCTSLASIVIPNSVTSIESSVFNGCTSLTSVTLPNNIVKINEYTFEECKSLSSITIPNSVVSIFSRAFSDCDSLVSVTIPDNVKYIADDTFPLRKKNLTIYGAAGSHAETYAQKRGYAFATAQAPADTAAPLAYARTQLISVDGKDVTFEAYALKDGKGNETNYVKLRDLAYVLNGTAAQFQVGWENGAVVIQSKTAYTPNGTEMKTPYSGNQKYTDNTSPVQTDGAALNSQAIVISDKSGGYTYFKLRDLGAALNFNVSWNGSAGKIEVDTTKPYSGV